MRGKIVGVRGWERILGEAVAATGTAEVEAETEAGAIEAARGRRVGRDEVGGGGGAGGGGLSAVKVNWKGNG